MNPKKTLVSLAEKFGLTNSEPKSEAAKALLEARRGLVARYVELANAQETLALDDTLNDAEKSIQLAKLANNRSEWAFEKSARAQAKALLAMNNRRQEIESIFTPKNPNTEARHGEIRSMLRSMETNERMDEIRKVLLRFDANPEDENAAEIVLAIASAPQEMSKAIHLQYVEAREKIARRMKPEAMDAGIEIEDELRLLEMASRNFDAAISNEYIKPAAAARKKQQASQQVLSAAIH